MSSLRTTSGDTSIAFLLTSGDTVVTATLRRSSDLITSGWHATKKDQDGQITLLLSLELLLNASTEAGALDEVKQLASDHVLPLVSNIRPRTRTSALSKPPSKMSLAHIAETHIRAHRDSTSRQGARRGVIETTAREYALATQFGVSAPAPLLARLDNSSAKTIHQRLFLAREQGLLESFGKGRTTPAEEVGE